MFVCVSVLQDDNAGSSEGKPSAFETRISKFAKILSIETGIW